MAFPVVYNLNTGQSIDPNAQSFYAGGRQRTPHPYGEQLANAGIALGAGGLGVGAAMVAHRMGVPVADYALSAVRTIEEYSPGQVLRTFQMGNVLSQFSSGARQSRFISPEQILGMTQKGDLWLTELMDRIHGPGSADKKGAITKFGLTFKDGRLSAGDTTIFQHAGIVRNVGQPRFSMGYSRAHSNKPVPLRDGFPTSAYTRSFMQDVEYMTEGGLKKESFYITGSDTRLGHVTGQMRGYAAEVVDRFNRLAQAPFEMQPIKGLYESFNASLKKHTGFSIDPGVRPGAALPTMGRLALKWGGVLTGGMLAYQTADWATREFPGFNGTILDQGITAGVATAWAKTNLFTASVADSIPGMRAYQQWQEEAAPGSTSLHRLAAYPLLGTLAGSVAAYGIHFSERRKLVNKFMEQGADKNLAFRQASEQLAETIRKWNPANPVDRLGERFSKSRYGAALQKVTGQLTPTKFRAMAGFGVGLALVAPFIPGALIPENTYEEQKDIYSGKKEIAVRKGRWWEFGRTPYEGSKVSYYRPHWYPLMVSRAREKSIWGGWDDLSPVTKFWKKEFTYDLEQKNFWNRPYPITGTFGEDIPLIGPLVAATLGRMIKPPRLMHSNEWTGGSAYSEGATSVLRHPPREGEEYALHMGEALPGTPANPYGLTKLAGEQFYRFMEQSGLVGFAAGSIKQKITGSEGFADQEEILQSARRMFGAERSYWDRDIGGGMGTTELVRRLFPHRRREIPEYNPIRNMMPDWMPGPGDRSPDFLHGDPYAAVTMGDVRLPGAGYEALHPELEGLTPDQYPLMHKYKILADIAPYSEKTKAMGFKVKAALKRGELSELDAATFKQINEQMIERKQNKEFYEYQYLEDDVDLSIPGAQQSREFLAAINRNVAANRDSQRPNGATSTLAGTYWESLIKIAYSPFEFATPIAPAHKLIALRSAVESYEDTQLYGGENAFWQHPIEHFLKPMASTTANLLGWDGVPGRIQQRRDIQEYFDILEYIKARRIEEDSLRRGDMRTAAQWGSKSEETLTGLNPYSFNFQNVYRALPREERDYFKAFSEASTAEDRERILEMVPDNEKRLYRGRWTMGYVNELKKLAKSPETTEEQNLAIQQEITKLLQDVRTEGFPINEDLHERYMKEATGSEDYADWYRRAIYIPSKLSETGVPGPDWVGWHPNVDLDDVKLKMVESLGLDMYTFDLWQNDKRRVAAKDFLEDPSVLAELEEPISDESSPEMISNEIRELLAELDIPQSAVIVTGMDSNKQSIAISLDVTEDRRKELRKRLNDLG